MRFLKLVCTLASFVDALAVSSFVFEQEIAQNATSGESVTNSDIVCLTDDECIVSYGRKEIEAFVGAGLFVKKTVDGGVSWGPEIEVEPIVVGGLPENQRISCSNGVCVMIYANKRSLQAKYSTDRGESWQASAFTNLTMEKVLGGSCDVSCFQADSEGKVRCLATAFDEIVGQYSILASNDDGASFQTALTFVPPFVVGQARLKCLDRQFCVAAFTGFVGQMIFMRTPSGDISGLNWLPRKEIGISPDAAVDAAQNGVISLSPDIAIMNSQRVVIVGGMESGSRIAYVERAVSDDGGFNFSNFTTILSISKLVEFPQRTVIACSDRFGKCFMSWDSRTDQLYFAESSDSGLTFGIPQTYSNLPVNQPFTEFGSVRSAFTGDRCISVFNGVGSRNALLASAITVEIPTTQPTQAPNADDSSQVILFAATGCGAAIFLVSIVLIVKRMNNRQTTSTSKSNNMNPTGGAEFNHQVAANHAPTTQTTIHQPNYFFFTGNNIQFRPPTEDLRERAPSV